MASKSHTLLGRPANCCSAACSVCLTATTVFARATPAPLVNNEGKADEPRRAARHRLTGKHFSYSSRTQSSIPSFLQEPLMTILSHRPKDKIKNDITYQRPKFHLPTSLAPPTGHLNLLSPTSTNPASRIKPAIFSATSHVLPVPEPYSTARRDQAGEKSVPSGLRKCTLHSSCSSQPPRLSRARVDAYQERQEGTVRWPERPRMWIRS